MCLIEYFIFVYPARLTCKSGSSTGGGSSGSGCGGQVVPEELPHSIRLLLARSDRLINTADVSK